MTMTLRTRLACLVAIAAAVGASAWACAAEPAEKTAHPWEDEVRAYEKQDAKLPPPLGAILFVGSSSVRTWGTLARDLAPTPALNRGIGGSQITDQIYYVDRLVVRYKPAQIVFYAGDKDVWARKTAETILADFKTFVEKVRKDLPRTPIHFLAIKPSPSREKVWPEARKANDLVRRHAQAEANLSFIDVATPMLGPDGKPRAELFLKDMLHMNRTGYEVWVPLVKAALAKPATEGQ
ncbi:MAG TPA: SGNH/GDSL hydrolase family protein [Phycisphaerae bacterium]|nr:SGNH/GDSL hydrolase family protein [Phycisphaerae bacterium]